MMAADMIECAGKLLYANAAEAQRALTRIQGRTRGDRSGLMAYRCADCGAWHLGRSKRFPKGE